MTDKHTPGPWEWVPDGEFGAQLVHFYDRERCNYVVVCDDGSASGEYTPAVIHNGPDGRLIAAAPDLLAALDDILNAYGPDEVSDAIHASRAVIAKARGQL